MYECGRENHQQRDDKAGSKCDDSLTYEEVKAALKRMKKGKGVGGDKFNFEMLEKRRGVLVAQSACSSTVLLGGKTHSARMDGRYHCSTA